MTLNSVIGLVCLATAGRVLHGLLLSQWAGRSLELTVWLVASVAMYVAWRRRVWRGVDLALPVLLVVRVVAFSSSYLGVASDGRDYFVQARSIALEHDLDISDAEVAAMDAPGLAPVYPVGTAVLWAPFLLATHAWLGVLNALGGTFARDGLSSPYMQAAGLATLCYGFGALVLIAAWLRRYFAPGIAAAATLLVCGGTFLFWYLTVEASMSHGASFFAVTLFLSVWHGTTGASSVRQWALLGAATGLMALVRWQDGLFALVLPVDAAIAYWRTWRGSAGGETLHALGWLRRHAAMAATAAAIFSLQLWSWHRNSAGWLAVPTGEFHVDWFDAFPANVLFSPYHGLFTWTPLVALAVLGLLPFIRRQPRVGVLLAAMFIAQVYANSVVEGWWGGSAFGARRFAGCGLVFAAGLAALLDWSLRRPVAAVSTLVAPFVCLNLWLMQDVRLGRITLSRGLPGPALLQPVYDRLGNPFSLPASLAFAREHGVSPSRYDQLGERTYNTLSLDIGTPGDALFLTYGWSTPESNAGRTYRWTVGDAAGVALPIGRRDDYRLRLRALPFRPDAQSPVSMLDVLLNGQRITRLALADTLAEYDVLVPRDAWRQNLNHLRFEFTSAASPRDAGLSGDPRALAVLFEMIAIERQVPPR
jgi:hypothetical protein